MSAVLNLDDKDVSFAMTVIHNGKEYKRSYSYTDAYLEKTDPDYLRAQVRNSVVRTVSDLFQEIEFEVDRVRMAG